MSPPIRCVASCVRLHARRAPRGPRRPATSRRCTPTPRARSAAAGASSLAASASASRSWSRKTSTPALAHPRDELVVLVLRPLDPQHVVEQQVVVVGRGQPLEAELRPVDHHLAQLADLGVDSERLPSFSFSLCRRDQAATTWVPAVAVDDLLDLARGCRSPLACRSPPRTAPPLRPSGPSTRRRTAARAAPPAVTCSSRRCSGVPQSAYTPSTSVAMTNRSASTSRASSSAGEVLVDHGLDADQAALAVGHGTSSGCRRRRRRSRRRPCRAASGSARISKMRFGSRRRHHPPPGVAVLLERPALLRGELLAPGPCVDRPDELGRVRRTPGRSGRPRPS